jgi:hypothetical protein
MPRIARKTLILVVSALLTVVLSPWNRGNASADESREFVRAEIVFIPWDVTFAVGHSPEMVRQAPFSRHVATSPKEIAALVQLLRAEPFTGNDRTLGDCRLVVDLVRADGTKASYAAVRGWLVDLSNGGGRKIDSRFEKHFPSAKPLL